MEILGLSESTPKTENRLKALLWPSIQSGSDVDYLGAQGYWVCTIVAVVSLVLLVVTKQPLIAVVTFLYFYLGGVGVRERSFFAASLVFILYTLDALLSGLGIVRILFIALLFSNMRATWLSSQWKPESEEAALPPRFGETLGEKFADKLPQILWPKLRILYFIFAIGYLVLVAIGLGMLAAQRIAR